MAKDMEMTFSLGAKLASSFNAAFGAAGSYMSQFSKRTENFAKTAGNIKTFENMQKKLEGHQKALADYQKRLKSIQFSGNTAELGQLNSKIAESQNVISREASQLDTLRSSLQGAGVDMKNLTSEHARFSAAADRSAQAQARYTKVQARLDRDKQALSWNSLKGGVLGAAAGVMMLAPSVNSAMKFDQGMAQVKAVSPNMNDSQFASLRNMALEQAGRTKYNTTEVAKTLENLARSGMGYDDMKNSLPSVLNMAGAGDIGLDQAASIMANVQGAFGLGANQSEYISNILAKGAALSNTTIPDLAEAIKNFGPVANTMGLSLKDSVAYLDALAKAGINAGEAGNAMKRGFLQITGGGEDGKQSKAQEQLSKLGISYKDAKGNVRRIEKIMADLQAKIGKMGKADQAAIMKNIFGAEALPAMSALMNVIQSGAFDNFAQELENVDNAAAKMYKTMTDTPQGAVTALSSAWDVLLVSIGEPLLDPFKDIVKDITEYVTKITEFVRAHPEVVKSIASVVSAFSVFSAGIVAVKAGIALIDFPFAQISKWSAQLGLAGVKSLLFADRFKSVGTIVSDGFKAIGSASVNAFKIAGTAIRNFGTFSIKTLKSVGSVGVKAFKTFGNIGVNAFKSLGTFAGSALNIVGGFLTSPWGLAIGAVAAIGAGVYALYKNWDKVKEYFANAEWWQSLKKWGLETWESIKTGASNAWESAKSSASAFGEWMSSTGASIWDGMKSGWDATKELVATGWMAYEESVNKFQGWLLEKGASLWDGIVSGWETAKGLISEGWTALEGMVTKFGEWLSNIGSTIWNGLTTGWDAAKGALEEGLNWVGSAWDKTASFAGDMWDGIKSFVGFENTGNDIVDQKALAQQLSDITVLDKMSKTFADRVAAMTNEWQPFKQSLAEGFENIFSVMTQLVTKITGEFVPAIQQASQSFRDMQTSVSAVAIAAGGGVATQRPVGVSSYAFGGAMAKGGILNGPQIILAGEAGAEAVIPLTNDRYGLPLLQQAASALGLDVVSPEHSFSDLSGLTSAGSSTTTNTVTNEPVINIPIQVDGGLNFEELATKIRDLVADFIRTTQEDQLRGAFV